MSFGDDRTRAMAVLVAQMRALGQAAFPFRGELAFSSDAGQRLAAIAIAQVQPDPAMLEWLASRVGPSERPFVQYNAAQALVIAARNGDASQAVSLEQAYVIALSGYEKMVDRERMSRRDLLEELGEEVKRLRTAMRAAT